jgi:bacterioferritin-associated ferredoxin
MDSEARRRLICRCLGVSSASVYRAARAGAHRSVADVTNACGAGGGCGLCRPEIEEILADVRGEPVDAALALENQLVCRQETQARVEGSLASCVAPLLAPRGARIARVRVDGLSVRVTLAGHVDAAARQIVAERLRAAVCDELEVEIEGAPDLVG